MIIDLNRVTLFMVFILSAESNRIPCVVTTWTNEGFKYATKTAYDILASTGDRLEALVSGLSECERLQCDGTVGFGGSPDESNDVRLDAMVFDGVGHKVGAIGSMGGIRDAARVAYAVMKYTQHTLIVGDMATKFALEMGFRLETLVTNHSHDLHSRWKSKKCQPNYRQNVSPDAKLSCGPYSPVSIEKYDHSWKIMDNHDTIGIIVVDKDGNVAGGTSTNGKMYKIPGRVGDSPIPGAGAYVDNEVGAAVGTGDGDIMIRFVPSYAAVADMRSGSSPQKAARMAIRRITSVYPEFFGAVVAVSKSGEYGAACNGMDKFGFSVRNMNADSVKAVYVKCH